MKKGAQARRHTHTQNIHNHGGQEGRRVEAKGIGNRRRDKKNTKINSHNFHAVRVTS